MTIFSQFFKIGAFQLFWLLLELDRTNY